MEKTCESVVSQTYQDFEWIVIDGGSNQKTLDIINNYKERIDILVSEKDSGIYNAMNKGIILASGEYCQFLNAGDYYFNKNSLQKVAGHLSQSDIVFGDLKFLEPNGNSYIKKFPNKIPYGWLFFDSLPHPSSFIKKELFQKHGLYNEEHKIVSDWEKWVELIDVAKCSYKHIPVLVAVHNHKGISATESDLHINERAEVLTKYYGSSTYEEVKSKKYIKFLGVPIIKIAKKFDTTHYYFLGIPFYKKIHGQKQF